MQSATFRSRSSKPFPLLLSLKWLSSLILVSLIMPLVTASIPANFASVVKSTPQTANATGTSQLTSTSSSASAVSAQASEKYGQLPLSFEENQGQVDEQVKFFSRGSGYSLFLTPAEMVFSLRKPRPASAKESRLPDLAKFGAGKALSVSVSVRRSRSTHGSPNEYARG